MRYPDRPKVCDLRPGDKVEWDRDRSVVAVQNVETDLHDEEGSITVVARAECRGPQGGRVVLETTSTGRNRAKVGNKSYAPAYTVDTMAVLNR